MPDKEKRLIIAISICCKSVVFLVTTIELVFLQRKYLTLDTPHNYIAFFGMCVFVCIFLYLA